MSNTRKGPEMNIWELQPKTPQFYYYNEEWNDPRDEDHEDFVDTYIEPKEDTTYYDDYEDYGN
tara:strand:- start:772 stop:960 length:189 start_codon:yes stop_codon:yes gene_type:complete